MKKSLLRKNQKGFTLIEIIAVLVILGILAAVAIPKYLDMRADAVNNAAKGAMSELNARERLALAQSKLKDSTADTYYTVNTYDLGPDYVGSADVTDKSADADATMRIANFKGKVVVFKKAKAADKNTPAIWTLVSVN